MTGSGQQMVLETLLAHLRPVQLRRRGAALGVWGEAGIGKSHVTREVLRSAGLRGHVFAARTPLAELALQLPPPRTVGTWAQSQLDALRRGEGAGEARTAELLGSLLPRLAPVVLVLEDLHEADETQRAGVAGLARAVQDMRGVALLVTGRQPVPEPLLGLQLGRLNDDAFRTVLEGDLRAPLPPEALDWLTGRAQGNPLFGLESLRYLARQGHLWNDGQHWRWRPPPADWLPVTVETLIDEQIRAAASTAAVRAALDALALLPEDVPPDVWAAVAATSADDLRAAQAAARGHGILTAGTSPGFSHPLFREVLVRAMPGHTREHLARAAVEALRTRDPLAAAALVPAAGLPPDTALAVLLEAAQRAEADGLRGRAGRLLASASGMAQGGRRAALALDAARALLRVDLPEAERLARVATEDAACRAGARLTLAEVLASQGRLADAERLSVPDGTGGHPTPDPARRLVLGMLARHIPQALAVWRSHPEVQRSPDVDVQLAGLRALVNTGSLDEARPVLDALAARTDLSVAQRLTLETQDAVLHLQAGELETAAARLDALAPRLLVAGEDRAAAIVRHNQGVALERLGRYAQAVAQELEAARHYAAAGDARGFAAVRTAAAWNLWHFGRYDEAETLLLEAREVLRGGAPSIMLVECEGMLSLLYLDWSPPLAVELAQRYATSALDTARAIGDTAGTGACLYDLAMVRLRQGRWADALALTDELEALCAAHGLPGLVVDAHHARALALEGLGDAAGALALLRQAVLDNASGSAMFTRKLETDVARLAGDLDLARTLLAWYRERGLHGGVQRLLALFPALGGAAEGDATPSPPMSGPVLEVLGPMQVRRGTGVQAVRGARRRDVLALLLAARLGGHAQVPRVELLDAVYPGQPDAQASAALRDVIHHLRQLCGAGAILTTPDGYALGAIGSDAETYLATGDVTLWRGAAWQDVDRADVLGETRTVLHAALHAHAVTLVDARPHEAERVGRVLLDGDPYDLDALRVLLSALRAGGRHATLGRTYARARTRLREVDEHLPETWTAFLAAPTSAS